MCGSNLVGTGSPNQSDHIHSYDCSHKKDDLDYLHQAKIILKRRIKSFPEEEESRIDSIIRELADYGNIEYRQYDRIFIQIVTSSAAPLMMNELNQLVSAIDGKFPQKGLLLGVGSDEKMGAKILLQLVFSCLE